MKNKRLIALVTSLVLTIGVLAGCGSNSSNNTGEKTDPAEKVEIDIFQFKVETKDALEAAVAKYMNENENVTINVQTVGGGDDYGAALKSKFASGQEPTIYNIGGTQDAIDWQEKLEDLTGEPWVSQAFDGSLDAVTLGGKIYGLPFNQEGYGFIYNKAILEKADVDAAAIKTFADLEAAVKTLDSKKDELGLDAVFALPGKETWVTGLHLSNVAFANEFETVVDAFNAKEIGFTQNEGLQKLLDLQIEYGFKPDGKSSSMNSVDYSTQVEQKFSLGTVAIIQQGNWAFGSVDGIDSELAQNIGILPMPIDGVSEGSIPVGIPMYWAINSNHDDAQIVAAKDFLNWLYTSDTGKDMIINDFKFIPAFKGYESDNLQPGDPLAKEVLRYSNEGNTMPWVFMGYPTGWGMDKLGADIQSYIAGDLAWADLVQNAKDSWTESRK